MKSQMALSINRRGYPALLCFAVIALISMLFFAIYANPLKWCFAYIFSEFQKPKEQLFSSLFNLSVFLFYLFKLLLK